LGSSTLTPSQISGKCDMWQWTYSVFFHAKFYCDWCMHPVDHDGPETLTDRSRSNLVPMCGSQTMTLVSYDAVASRAPSGEKSQPHTSCRCPSRYRTALYFTISQSITWLKQTTTIAARFYISLVIWHIIHKKWLNAVPLATIWNNPQSRMWANAQPDGRPAKHRCRPLFNATKFGWRPLLDAVQ